MHLNCWGNNDFGYTCISVKKSMTNLKEGNEKEVDGKFLCLFLFTKPHIGIFFIMLLLYCFLRHTGANITGW